MIIRAMVGRSKQVSLKDTLPTVVYHHHPLQSAAIGYVLECILKFMQRKGRCNRPVIGTTVEFATYTGPCSRIFYSIQKTL